jgi:two-component system, NtrC family, response regulator AtoC
VGAAGGSGKTGLRLEVEAHQDVMFSVMTRESILVVDDDPALRTVLVGLFTQAGYSAHAVSSAKAAIDHVAKQHVDLVVTDLRMPEMDGMALLAELAASAPEIAVIMISAHATVPLAVEAMKAGAKEFFIKPFDRDEVISTVERVLEAHVRGLGVPALPLLDDEGAVSESMREARDLMTRAARSSATVLLRGESGTGKEVAARRIHAESARRAGPFVAVHCAALPASLLESELFGYEKGAFTGAAKRKPGRVELAAGGTVLLDEIGDVGPEVQVKLLRLLQEKEFQRVGGTRPERVDVRFIAATHRDLETMVSRGEFREDFFYRLNVLPIWLPPLRERRDTIPALAAQFCAAAALDNGRPAMLSPDALALLREREWSGNVRELRSFVERLVVFSDGAVLSAADVRREVSRGPRRAGTGDTAPLTIQRGEAERQAISEALDRAHGNRSTAARLLGVSRRTLYNKLSDLGLKS